jgi:hypothetical protein
MTRAPLPASRTGFRDNQANRMLIESFEPPLRCKFSK